MTLLEFYKKTIEGFGFITDEEGYIYTKDKEPVMVGGKFIVLPYDSQIENLFTVDDEGNTVSSKMLYNPINEDIVKGDTASLKATKLYAEQIIGFGVASVGELLLRFAADKSNQQKTTLELNKFMEKILEAQNTGIKQLVDEKSIDSWSKLANEYTSKGESIIEIFLKKKGKLDGKDFNRIAVLHSKLYDELMVADKDTSVEGVKLRNKDLIIFRIIFNSVLSGLTEDGTMSVGSNNPESPAFVSLMIIYIRCMNKILKLLKDLKHVEESIYDAAYINSELLEESEIYEIAAYKSELIKIPSELDINRSIKLPSSSLSRPDMSKAASNKINAVSDVTYSKNSAYPKDIVAPVAQAEEESDPVARALFGSRGNGGFMNNNPVGINNPAIFNSQPAYNPYGIMPAQPQPVPMGMVPMQGGFNNMQQPMMGSPMPQPAVPLNQQRVMGVNSIQQRNPLTPPWI